MCGCIGKTVYLVPRCQQPVAEAGFGEKRTLAMRIAKNFSERSRTQNTSASGS